MPFLHLITPPTEVNIPVSVKFLPDTGQRTAAADVNVQTEIPVSRGGSDRKAKSRIKFTMVVGMYRGSWRDARSLLRVHLAANGAQVGKCPYMMSASEGGGVHGKAEVEKEVA